MLELIIIIIACRATYKEAKKLKINALPYILATIGLGFIPSSIVHFIIGISTTAAIISLIITTFLCFIPYILLTQKQDPMDDQ